MRSLLHIIALTTGFSVCSAISGHAQQPQIAPSLEQQLSHADSVLTALQHRFPSESPQVQIAGFQRQLLVERLRNQREVALLAAEADLRALEYRFTTESSQVKGAALRLQVARRDLCDVAANPDRCATD